MAVVAAATVAQRTADLAGPVDDGMNVGVGGTGANRPHELFKFARGDALPDHVENLLRRDRPADGPFPCARAFRRCSGDGRRCPGDRLAQPNDDAADGMPLAEMDMRLGDVALEPAVAQLVVDDVPAIVDLGAEAPAGYARDRASQRRCRCGDEVDLVVTRKSRAKIVRLAVVRRGRKTEGESGNG